MITDNEFFDATLEFDNLEKRSNFYDMAINLITNKFEIEAYILILATWNFAGFRFFLKKFNIFEFKKLLKELDPYFKKLQNEEIRTIDFDLYKADIMIIYNSLSLIEGIKYTGASKLMHLKNRNLFVMWDTYIKGSKALKHYKQLEIVKKGVWKIKKFGDSAEDFFQFLKDMQELFKNIGFNSDKKTFAKAIDEFNYVKITLPVQAMEKKKNK